MRYEDNSNLHTHPLINLNLLMPSSQASNKKLVRSSPFEYFVKKA